MPKLLLPLVALALAGGSVGAYFWLTSEGSVEETAVLQPTATPTPAPTTQPTATVEPTPAPDGWLTYTDPDYGFGISYPPNFVIEILEAKGGDLPGILKLVRAVDAGFTAGYPSGQVEFGVYAKDAGALSEWLSEHSDTAPSPFRPTYHDVTNVMEATASGRPTLSFDSFAGEAGTVHSTVFFSGPNVFVIDWFASDPTYEPTIKPIFERMLASFRD